MQRITSANHETRASTPALLSALLVFALAFSFISTAAGADLASLLKKLEELESVLMASGAPSWR